MQMAKQIQIVDFSDAKSVQQLIEKLNQANRLTQEAYRKIYNDIHLQAGRASGSFTTVDGKTVTVVKGIITSIL